ncbi:DUF3243 domain-containing protein [Dehalobacterium formicoaceticum]|uniref:DUF3243 domain-containing protein n=1 Tax=Dehalobacterium formicoaceticum TaxID=51515 RepID=A0ABT1Y404_9FIRM|nr:DUF3243 family protein [Dehalobacterium formicoaceticum]MCR6545607.1 DUF3243 domain-containing protein [Dehalobacterium formicoaceticum]
MKQMLDRLDTSSWEQYKHSLGEAMEFANDMGISEDEITQLAQTFGSYLANNISPDIPENKALKELWEVATPEEQATLTSLMIKLAKNS